MQKIKLISLRFGNRVEHFYNTIKEAAFSAVMDVEYNEACPAEILDDGKLVWKYEGPTGESMDKLRELAEWEDDEE